MEFVPEVVLSERFDTHISNTKRHKKRERVK
jgi:hypothetical protein